jgi:gliding motility-associated-like protein
MRRRTRNVKGTDRWGELVFETKDTTAGWDGTYGGLQAKEGVYTWKMTLKSSTTDERTEYEGHVVLLR